MVAGANGLVDIVESDGEDDRWLEVPWHFRGEIRMISPGEWKSDTLGHPKTTDVQRFEPTQPGPLAVEVRRGDAMVHVRFEVADGAVWRIRGPTVRPGDPEEVLLLRRRGRHLRFVTSLDWNASHTLDAAGDLIVVERADTTTRHLATTAGWSVEEGDDRLRLAGMRGQAREAPAPVGVAQKPLRMEAIATRRDEDAVLDGSLDGFPSQAPMHLDHEDQYRRSEAPYAGPETFRAVAYPAWHAEAFCLAVEVSKEDLFFRDPGDPPLLLDNESDDIHSDGVQVYLADHDGEQVFGCVAVPSADGEVTVRLVTGDGRAAGAWQKLPGGYRLTLALSPSWWDPLVGESVGFDLIVNEARPDRDRRAGQLVWSGGGGWVWLRGDRQDPSRFGTVELR